MQDVSDATHKVITDAGQMLVKEITNTNIPRWRVEYIVLHSTRDGVEYGDSIYLKDGILYTEKQLKTTKHWRLRALR
jgi:hypothetical protein